MILALQRSLCRNTKGDRPAHDQVMVWAVAQVVFGRSQIQALSLNQLKSLGEALFDFTKPSDLDDWM